jgi:hypothetical protein
MRGFLKPALKRAATDSQKAFAALTRGKRTKLAKLAQTTLVKADQWARGDGGSAEVGDALERALASLKAKKKKS